MKNFNKIILFSFFLITMLLNHSILYQIIGVLLILFAFIGMVIKKKIHFHIFFLFYLLFMLFIYWQISSGLSYDVSESQRIGLTVAINIIVYFSLFNYIINNSLYKESLRYYVICAFITAIFLIAFSLIKGSLFGGRLMETDEAVHILGVEMEYNSNSIANFCCLSSAIIIFSDSLFKKQGKIPLLMFFLFVILISGSRKALLLFILSVAIKYFSTAKLKNIFLNISLVVVILWGIYYLIMNVPIFYAIIGERFETMFDFFQGGGDSSMTARADYLDIGWLMFKEHFWFGVGLANFMSFGNTAAYSHNDYIELLSGCGIVGFTLAYLPKISVFISNFKSPSKYRLLFSILMLQLFVAAIGTVSYYKREDWLLFIIVMAFCYYYNGLKSKDRIKRVIDLRQRIVFYLSSIKKYQ